MIRFFFTRPAGHLNWPSSDRRGFSLSNITRNYTIQGGPAVVRDKGGTAPAPPLEELVLKVAKEIVVKFIEVGRLTPTTFPDTFKLVIDTVRQSLKD